MKKCPYCAEEIQDEAIICRYCGKDLVEKSKVPEPSLSIVKPAKKTNYSCLIIVLISLVVVIILFISLSGGGTGGGSIKTDYVVQYKVYGSAVKASLTYENAGGDTAQLDTYLPWEYTMTVKRGAFVYISAQNETENGTIICEILVDGKSVKTTTSRGAFVIATCSGKL